MRAREKRARRVLACACVALVLSAVRAQPAPDKRADSEFMSPNPFLLGTRYGRSPPRTMVPRTDRFFMTGRYGKRSELPALPLARPPTPHKLYCEFTGVDQLYRCSFARGSLENRRLSDNRELGDDE